MKPKNTKLESHQLVAQKLKDDNIMLMKKSVKWRDRYSNLAIWICVSVSINIILLLILIF